MIEGVLTKMTSDSKSQNQIDYFLCFDNSFLHVNQFLDKKISISPQGCQCLGCQKKIDSTHFKVFFSRGLCRKCFNLRPEAGDWIISPELSKAHLDIEDRDLEFEKKYQLQPHIVYLASTNKIKVGVTRKEQMITRWIDQGAHQAIKLIEVPNRYLAGITEVALKKHYASATSWQKMLQGSYIDVDWEKEKTTALDFIPPETKKYINSEPPNPVQLEYPVKKYPSKPKTSRIDYQNLQNEPIVGTLKGIRGQYLIFDDDRVFNVRRHEGHMVTISVNKPESILIF
ncbi:MAG: DUF2797 domain-containing protein [Flavobacteriaceae bacterium]|nr:DUF2797 domain-containing protein [Flavobacteriaceae bacterium]